MSGALKISFGGYFEKMNPSLKSMIEELYTDNKTILTVLESTLPPAPSGSVKMPDYH